jgi:hypothetical protein
VCLSVLESCCPSEPRLNRQTLARTNAPFSQPVEVFFKTQSLDSNIQRFGNAGSSAETPGSNLDEGARRAVSNLLMCWMIERAGDNVEIKVSDNDFSKAFFFWVAVFDVLDHNALDFGACDSESFLVTDFDRLSEAEVDQFDPFCVCAGCSMARKLIMAKRGVGVLAHQVPFLERRLL